VRETYTGTEYDGIYEDNDGEGPSSAEGHDQILPARSSSADGHIDAEYISLHLPSHFKHDWCNRNATEDLAKAELRLREGQLNDSLHQIQIALGHKSYIFRHDVRLAKTQRLKTCAWADVHAIESTVQQHAAAYTHARQAIVDLGASSDLLHQYKLLTCQDLTIKTTILAPHVRGQRNKSLPWFWTMDVLRDADIGEWMKDCTYLSVHTCQIHVTFDAVF
jgi:hypothetical protein